MLRKPSGEGVGAPVGQNVHQRVTLEVHQNRPVASPTTECEVVHAQDSRCLVSREPHRVDVGEQGISGGHDPEAFQKARACLTSEKSEGDVREPAFKSFGPASVVRGESGQAFREDRPVASPLVTEEPSDAQMHSNRDSLPWQVGQHPRVPGMDPG
jgi:hypothetical protein